MQACMNEMINSFATKGFVTEEDMDKLGIMSVNESTRTIPKDQRVRERRAAVPLNTRERAEAKAIEKERKKQEKEIEKARFNALSEEEKKAERKAKKEANKAAKEAKLQATQALEQVETEPALLVAQQHWFLL